MSRRTNLNTIRNQDGWGRWAELNGYAPLVTLDNKVNNYLIGIFYSLKMPTSYYVIRRFYSSLAIIEMDILMFNFNRQRLFISSERLFYLVINRFRRWLRRFVTSNHIVLHKWKMDSLLSKKKKSNKWQKPSSFRSNKKTRARTLLKYARRRLRKHRFHKKRRFFTKRRKKSRSRSRYKRKYRSMSRYMARKRARSRYRSISRSMYLRILFFKQRGKESSKSNTNKPRTTIEIRSLSRNAALFLRLSAIKTASCFFKKTRKRKLLCLLPRRFSSRLFRRRRSRSRRRIRRFTLFARSLCRTVLLYTRHLCSSVIRANMRRLSEMSSLVNVNAHVTQRSTLLTPRVMSGTRRYPPLYSTQKRYYSKKAIQIEKEVTILDRRESFVYDFYATRYVPKYVPEHTTVQSFFRESYFSSLFLAYRLNQFSLSSHLLYNKTITTSEYKAYEEVRGTSHFQWALYRYWLDLRSIKNGKVDSWGFRKAVGEAVAELRNWTIALLICVILYLIVSHISIPYYVLLFYDNLYISELFLISRLVYLFFYVIGAFLQLGILKKLENFCVVKYGSTTRFDIVNWIVFVLYLVLFFTYFNMYGSEAKFLAALENGVLNMILRVLEVFFMLKVPYIILCGMMLQITRTIMFRINVHVFFLWRFCAVTILTEMLFFMVFPANFYREHFDFVEIELLCVLICFLSCIFYILLVHLTPYKTGSVSLSIVIPITAFGYLGVVVFVSELFRDIASIINIFFDLHLSSVNLLCIGLFFFIILEFWLIRFIVRFEYISRSIYSSFSQNITFADFIAIFKGVLINKLDAYKLLRLDREHANVLYDFLKFDYELAGFLYNNSMSRLNPRYYIYVFLCHILFDWWKVPARSYWVHFLLNFFVCHIFLVLPILLVFL